MNILTLVPDALFKAPDPAVVNSPQSFWLNFVKLIENTPLHLVEVQKDPSIDCPLQIPEHVEVAWREI